VVRVTDVAASFAWSAEQLAVPPASVGWHTHFGVQLAGAERADTSIHYLMRARDGTHWMAASDVQVRSMLLRRIGTRIDTIPLSAYLDVRRIRHFVEDHEGSIWVGTDRGLLQLWSRKAFALTTRQGLGWGFTTAIVQTRDSAVWIGSYGGGLHRFARGRLTHRFTTETGLPRNDVRALYEAADGTLWVGMLEGYATIRGNTVSAAVTTSAEVRAFAETLDGSLWLGSGDNLLVRRAGANTFQPHDAHFWRDKSIWALHTARSGELWIGTEHGLFRLVDGMLETMDDGQGLRDRFVVSIYEERNGTLWFGTYEHGLYRRRGDRFTRVTTAEGLHHNGVWRIVEDDRGGMWMSSDQGVFRVDRQRLHDVADAIERGAADVALLRPLVFTEAEGMPNRESNRGSPAGWKLFDGRILFNNIAGVAVIDPAHATRVPPPPRTELQRVLIDGHAQSFALATPSRVSAGTRQLVFDYAALSFVAPNQNRYRYRVDSYDDEWVEAGSQRRATYTNLPPGHYVFRVQGATGTGEWSEPGVAHAFTVAPFLWQTWWFRGAALALCALLLTAAHRYRVQRALELERLRVRIAADLHDDVGSTLSSIALLTDMLQTREQLDDREQVQLRRIHRAASDAIDALRDVIWIVDPKHTTLAELLTRLRRVAADMLEGTNWTFDCTPATPERVLDMAFMRTVLLIYKETLHNIATHARAAHVRITIADADGVFDMCIEDDGAGFDEADTRRGRGLDSMRRRAQLAGAQLHIDSARGRGTRITFRVQQKVSALR
jgi:signal transduction histidine kinase